MARLPSPRGALALLTGLNFLNYIDRFIPAAILPTILASFGLTGAEGGFLQTMFILTMAFVSPIAGWLGDRHPRFRVAAAGVFVWSAATFGSGLAPTFAALVVARALIGVGEASYTVVTPSLLSDFYPTGQRARVLSIFYAAIPIGSALGYVLGSQIAAHFGWRYSFYVAGVPGLMLAIILLFLKEPTRGAQDAKPVPRPKRDGSTSSVVVIANAVRQLLMRRSFLINTISQTIYTFSVGGLAVWMPTYFVRERGLSEATASTTFGVVLALAGFTGTIIGGRLGDWMARRRPDAHFLLSGISLVGSLPFTVLAILSPTPAIFWPSMFVTLSMLFLNAGPLNAALANVLPAELRGRGFAFNTWAIHLFGDAASPPIIGWASDRVGLRAPVLGAGALMAVAGLVLLFGRGAFTRDLKAASA
jgi:MFS transporter, Spinster family, sphingosine-1-phosphate transporter